MGPPGDAPLARRPSSPRGERGRPHPELHQEPEEEVEPRRDLDEGKEEKEGDERDDPRTRVEDEVCLLYTSDAADE